MRDLQKVCFKCDSYWELSAGELYPGLEDVQEAGGGLDVGGDLPPGLAERFRRQPPRPRRPRRPRTAHVLAHATQHRA